MNGYHSFPSIELNGFVFTASMEVDRDRDRDWDRPRLVQRKRNGVRLWALPGSRIERDRHGGIVCKELKEATAAEIRARRLHA